MHHIPFTKLRAQLIFCATLKGSFKDLLKENLKNISHQKRVTNED